MALQPDGEILDDFTLNGQTVRFMYLMLQIRLLPLPIVGR